jgi:hypothetical protein
MINATWEHLALRGAATRVDNSALAAESSGR